MITDTQLNTLKHELLGTCQLLATLLERLEIDAPVEEAESRLLDGAMAVECCSGCGWWAESALMEYSESRLSPVCRQCEPELFE